MAYIVPRGADMWEIRESHTTPAGPRSRTLATFKTLTPSVVEKARSRSSKRLDAGDLRKAAARAGAPVQAPTADRAAAELLGELAEGRRPRAALWRLLLEALRSEPGAARDSAQTVAAASAAQAVASPKTIEGALGLAPSTGASDNARAAVAWMAATPKRHGEALRDLLLLVDHLPHGSARTRDRFPHIESKAV